MDFKVKIKQALDELEKLTGEGSTEGLRKEIERESNTHILWRKYQTLREVLAANSNPQEKVDVSFTVKLPEGKEARFPNLAAFDDYMISYSDPRFDGTSSTSGSGKEIVRKTRSRVASSATV